MKANFINRVDIGGYLYDHTLEKRVTGSNSKKPGTEYITGVISVATDEALTNIIQVHYTYITATTSKGSTDRRFAVLNDIIEGRLYTVMAHGVDKATKITVNSAIGLNEFISDRTGEEELVSAKRNEGGFINVVASIPLDKKGNWDTNRFEEDFLITGIQRLEADPERDLPEKMNVKGAIFDFRKSLLPVTFTILNPKGMDYLESLDISNKTPVFTRVRGVQVAETVQNSRTEEGAWGETIEIKMAPRSRKDYIITWMAPEPYEFDDESTITTADIKEMMAAREITIAQIKQRNEEYKASRGASGVTSAPTGSVPFDF